MSRSEQAQAYRQLYKTRQWRGTSKHQGRDGLRWLTFIRDLFTCKTCSHADATGRTLVADHIKPHKGDAALFFDTNNIQTLCKRCHDSIKQSEERNPNKGCDINGYPLADNHHWNQA